MAKQSALEKKKLVYVEENKGIYDIYSKCSATFF